MSTLHYAHYQKHGRIGLAKVSPYTVGVNLMPILAASIGIAVFRGVVSPLIAKYITWKSGMQRVQVARRNWRGVYVPDLNVKRGERIFWLAYLAIVAIGLAVGWTIMTAHP